MTEVKALEDLIAVFHKREIVKKLIESRGDLKIYEHEKKRLFIKLNRFKSQSRKKQERASYVINNKEYEIVPADALEICLICIMTGIDDIDLLEGYKALPQALLEIDGEKCEVAKKIAMFLGRTGCYDGALFSIYKVEKLMQLFFC